MIKTYSNFSKMVSLQGTPPTVTTPENAKKAIEVAIEVKYSQSPAIPKLQALIPKSK